MYVNLGHIHGQEEQCNEENSSMYLSQYYEAQNICIMSSGRSVTSLTHISGHGQDEKIIWKLNDVKWNAFTECST